MEGHLSIPKKTISMDNNRPPKLQSSERDKEAGRRTQKYNRYTKIFTKLEEFMLRKKTTTSLSIIMLLMHRGTMTADDLAENLRVSVSYIEKIMKLLKRSGLVTSKRGRGGGYSAGFTDLKLMSVRDIIYAVESRECDSFSGAEFDILNFLDGLLVEKFITKNRGVNTW